MSAQPITAPVPGAPYQPTERVRVARAIDREIHDVSALMGCTGTVVHLEYSCGAGQRYPSDPMIGVRVDGGELEEFWKDELEREAAVAAEEDTL